MKAFETINQGFNEVFQPGELSIGLVIPIEHYPRGPVPTMKDHLDRVKQVEALGFKALWVRDVPFNLPSFGDAGQTYDPFTYLGFLVGATSRIALGTGSVALPLRHPVHIAKSAATVDQLSDGRFIMGVASGDRPTEYPAMGIDFEGRGERFRKTFEFIRTLPGIFPSYDFEELGTSPGAMDVLPKPVGHKIPMLITGYSQQDLSWNAEHGDGWMYYPRDLYTQRNMIRQWRENIPTDQPNKPFMQPLYVVLDKNPDFKPIPIQLGYKTGMNYLVEYMELIRENGVNHVGINLRFNELNMDYSLNLLAEKLIPLFHRLPQTT